MKVYDPQLLRERTPWAFAVERDVRFQDVDAAGVVFFPRLLEYCNDTLVAWFASVGLSLANLLAESDWLTPVRACAAEFIKPLRFGDRVEVALVRATLADSEVTFGYRLARVADGAVVALVEVRHVAVDARSFARREVPEALHRALEPFSRT